MIEQSKNNNELGHEANREEKIMYLEAENGECNNPQESAEIPNPMMDSLLNKDDFIAKQSKNLAPVSR